MSNESDVYSARPLDLGTWAPGHLGTWAPGHLGDFAHLVEANNGVWGGCWCMAFHTEGVRNATSPNDNRAAKFEHVRGGKSHQVLVYAGDECVGWCQYGPPAELPNIKNIKAYGQELERLPDWRIGGIFTGNGHRGHGVARTAVRAALDSIRMAGGGLVEAYPEQSEGRPQQRGAYFQTGPESLYEQFGFSRVRRIAKWRWVMHLEVHS